MTRSARRIAPARATTALVMALACLLGLVVVRALAFGLDAGRARDAVTLHGFTGLYRYRLEPAIEFTAQLVDPLPYAFLGLLCVGVALARGRRARAVAVACVLVATGVATHVLKHLLAQARYEPWLLGGRLDPENWPSGHATAAMTLALCAVVVAPAAWRAGVAAVGLALAVALSYATLALTWHYPSDILAGFLVAGLGVALALAVLARVEAPEPAAAGPARLGALLAAGGAGALTAAALVARASERVGLDAGERATAAAGALAIAALALALLAATVVAARAD